MLELGLMPVVTTMTAESENLKNYVNFDLFLGSTMLSAVVNFEDQDTWYTTFNTLKYHFFTVSNFFS